MYEHEHKKKSAPDGTDFFSRNDYFEYYHLNIENFKVANYHP